MNGFVHLLDTAIKYGGYDRSAGMMAYQLDFSPIRNAWNRSSMADIVEGSTRVVGEVLGAGVAVVPMYQFGKTAAQVTWRSATFLWGRFGPRAIASARGLLGRETVQAAESALVSPLETVSKKEMVNLASKESTNHIIFGEKNCCKRETCICGRAYVSRTTRKDSFPENLGRGENNASYF